MQHKENENCFREFDDVNPKEKDPSLHVLFEYEKHYMELVREYADEIKLIDNMLRQCREEQTEFFQNTINQISDSLTQNHSIDDEMKKIWIQRLHDNMDRSFSISETLISDYATKKIDEFREAARKKMMSM